MSMTDQRNAESETPAKWRLLPPRVRLEDTVAEQSQIRAVNPLPDQKETEIEAIR